MSDLRPQIGAGNQAPDNAEQPRPPARTETRPVAAPPRKRLGWWTSLAVLSNRLSLGIYFLLAGVSKVKMGVSEFYHGVFVKMQPEWLIDEFARPFGHALPFLEILVGLLLIVGLFGRITAFCAFLLITSFTIAVYEAGGFIPEQGGPFHYNVIYITLTLLLLALGSGRISLDEIWRSRRS